MIKRDFSAESKFNLILRALRASSARIRGYVFKTFCIFSKGSGPKISFGNNPRIINSKSMYLGRGVHFGICARIECFNGYAEDGGPRLQIGDGTSFGDYCHVGVANYVKIGKNVLGASGILIIDHDHGRPKVDINAPELTDPKKREITSKGSIIIDDNVWIGERVVILGGARIGRGAIIAANSIVKGTVNERTIFFGD